MSNKEKFDIAETGVDDRKSLFQIQDFLFPLFPRMYVIE